MSGLKTTILLIFGSLLLLLALGWWMESTNPSPQENLLPTETSLEGPLSPKELAVTNHEMSNQSNPRAVIHTNKGDMTLELFMDTMPITAGNFIKLAQEGFYDSIKFHRVIDGFMIQAGDPNTKNADTSRYGTGGPGYTIEDEFVKGALLSNTRGTISMANTGQPHSGGSQFFINLEDNTSLDFDKPPFTSKHPVFGRVIDGMDVVDLIGKTPTDARNLPTDPIIIEHIDIVSSDSAS